MATLFSGAVAHAEPVERGIGLQSPVTEVMRDIISFHNLLLWIITAIVLFVLALLIIVMVRFNAKANPVPSKTTHNTLIEIAWTVIPVIILVIIAIPSFRLLYKQVVIPEAELTVKAVGYQWYWGYEYPDHGDISVISNMVEDADLQPGQPRLLAADEAMVVPVDTTVRVIVTAADVIHAFAVPPFGVKIDAIPGRLNETWFRAEKTGMYYGQCSELCGTRHAFMPINVKVVTQEEFEEWTQQQQAAVSNANVKVAEIAGTELR
jgi:cytochrome c oxidase subunit 2